ncbi:hypothetical protein BS47DRAFT_735334 [Hydnum rufescens UP504]|uniref:Vacuolar protein sorting-associated protein 13 VPS13 adaptor binding domain-containing protein n=1 Tax=Hydnum rufescens UP504 TaxID=1448309 RepID=A0A9P6DMB6_9AGAM|nr:hypothetical protein BS47DRAFT_735334 [Hydnum rufescens UP504]
MLRLWRGLDSKCHIIDPHACSNHFQRRVRGTVPVSDFLSLRPTRSHCCTDIPTSLCTVGLPSNLLQLELNDGIFKNTTRTGEALTGKQLRLSDKDGRKLDLRLHYWDPESWRAMKVRIYNPLVLVNHTGRPFSLRLGTSTVTSHEIGNAIDLSSRIIRYEPSQLIPLGPAVSSHNQTCSNEFLSD